MQTPLRSGHVSLDNSLQFVTGSIWLGGLCLLMYFMYVVFFNLLVGGR